MRIFMLELAFLASLGSSPDPLLEKATSQFFLEAQNLPSIRLPLNISFFC